MIILSSQAKSALLHIAYSGDGTISRAFVRGYVDEQLRQQREKQSKTK
jgi:hypothetical protein